MLYIKVCRCQDSNHGPVELEATALPTEPEPLKYFVNSCFEIYNSLRVLEDISMELAPHWLCVVSCRLVSCRVGEGVFAWDMRKLETGTDLGRALSTYMVFM